MAQELKSKLLGKTMNEYGCDTKIYLKSEVDAVLAEKDKEIERLDDLAHAHNIELLRKENLIAEKDAEIAGLKKKLDDLQARLYADSVDTWIRDRRLKRALWIARAKAWLYITQLIASFNPDYIRNRLMFTPNNKKQKQMNSLEWAKLTQNISRKCRAKAEEYK